MADKYAVFNEKDVAVLKEMVHWWRTYTHRDTEEHVDHGDKANDVFVAMVDSGGIPANSQALGTANNDASAGDQPGSAECDCYSMNSLGELVKLGPRLTVYNISPSAISGPSWVLIVKDKWGRWIATPSAVNTNSGGTTLQVFLGVPVNQIDAGTTGTVEQYSAGIGTGILDTCYSPFGTCYKTDLVAYATVSGYTNKVIIATGCHTGTGS